MQGPLAPADPGSVDQRTHKLAAVYHKNALICTFMFWSVRKSGPPGNVGQANSDTDVKDEGSIFLARIRTAMQVVQQCAAEGGSLAVSIYLRSYETRLIGYQ